MNENRQIKNEWKQSSYDFKTSRKKKLSDGLSFTIKESRYYNGEFPTMRRPIEIGSFVSDNRQDNINAKNLLIDKSAPNYGVKYLALPKNPRSCSFDLNRGSSKYEVKPIGEDGLDLILKWILNNKNKFETSSGLIKQSINTDFVCRRGLIGALLLIPYEKYNDIMFSVTKYKNTYYIREFETERKMNERLNMDEKLKMFTYWGYKFESYVTSDVEDGCISENILTETIDEEDSYFAVIRSQIGLHSLVYAAETDCCVSTDHKSLNNYCEIKTCKGESIKDLNFSRNIKFFKWWIQCFLVDIKRIIVGLRNDDGIVTNVLECNADEIFQLTRTWNANICFNFFNTLLNFIKSKCNQEDTHYLFTWEPNSEAIKCRKVKDAKYSAVPNWFET